MKTPDRSLIVEAARTWLGTRETSRNRFHGMVIIWESTSEPEGWREREPYCAAAVCRWIHAAVKSGLPLSGPRPQMPNVRTINGAEGWVDWANRNDHSVLGNRFTPMPGDIVVFWPHFSHIGIATGRVINGEIETIEANTNSEGSRDGDGFYLKTRKRSVIGSVIRLTLTGGKVV